MPKTRLAAFAGPSPKTHI